MVSKKNLSLVICILSLITCHLSFFTCYTLQYTPGFTGNPKWYDLSSHQGQLVSCHLSLVIHSNILLDSKGIQWYDMSSHQGQLVSCHLSLVIHSDMGGIGQLVLSGLYWDTPRSGGGGILPLCAPGSCPVLTIKDRNLEHHNLLEKPVKMMLS